MDTIGAKTPVFTDATKDTIKTVTSTPSANTSQTDAAITTPAANKPTVTPVTKVPAATTSPVNTAATEDTVAKGSWVIYNGAFPTRSGAEGQIDYDKGKGFAQARLLKKKVGRGGNYKVILGAFKTRAEAQSASQDLLVTGKIKKTELSVELYK
jgi:cell division protein FtsN